MKKKFNFNVSDFFCIICILCSLSGSLFKGGGIAIQGLQLILISMSMYYCFIANTKYQTPIYLKGLNILLIVFTIYGTVVIIAPPLWLTDESYIFLKQVYISMLPIYSFYVFSRRGQLTLSKVQLWYFIFFIMVIRSFIRQDHYLDRVIEESGTEYTDLTNNSGYYFVGLLPGLTFFKKKPVLQYILLAICGYFIIRSMKRGAMLCGLICFVWFIIANYKTSDVRHRWIIFLVTAAVIVFGVLYIDNLMSSSNFFQHRVEQTKAGDASNREWVYATLLEHFINEDDFSRLFFGNGVYSTLLVVHMPAHNDWLEIATCQGTLGLFTYIIYWICFFITWRWSRWRTESYMVIGMTLICYFLASCYSMSYDSMTRCATMSLGFALATLYTENELKQEAIRHTM